MTGRQKEANRHLSSEELDDAMDEAQQACMARSSEEPDKTTVSIRITGSQLADIDAARRDSGYSNRSTFIRETLRDAAKHPDFMRTDLKAMLASERDIYSSR